MMMLAGIDCCARRGGDGDVTVKVVQHIAPARASSPEAGVQACQTRERRSSLEAQTPSPARRSSLQAKRQTVSPSMCVVPISPDVPIASRFELVHLPSLVPCD
jgi:hypothetical protein